VPQRPGDHRPQIGGGRKLFTVSKHRDKTLWNRSVRRRRPSHQIPRHRVVLQSPVQPVRPCLVGMAVADEGPIFSNVFLRVHRVIDSNESCPCQSTSFQGLRWKLQNRCDQHLGRTKDLRIVHIEDTPSGTGFIHKSDHCTWFFLFVWFNFFPIFETEADGGFGHFFDRKFGF